MPINQEPVRRAYAPAVTILSAAAAAATREAGLQAPEVIALVAFLLATA